MNLSPKSTGACIFLQSLLSSPLHGYHSAKLCLGLAIYTSSSPRHRTLLLVWEQRLNKPPCGRTKYGLLFIDDIAAREEAGSDCYRHFFPEMRIGHQSLPSKWWLCTGKGALHFQPNDYGLK